MLLVAPVKEELRIEMSEEEESRFGLSKLYVTRSTVPAITHVNYSARLQTVNMHDNPLYHQMIESFDKKYGCPVIINTSFNVRGEPIVCTPEDAYNCFMHTNMDYMMIGSYLIDKEDQRPLEDSDNWLDQFELD